MIRICEQQTTVCHRAQGARNITLSPKTLRPLWLKRFLDLRKSAQSADDMSLKDFVYVIRVIRGRSFPVLLRAPRREACCSSASWPRGEKFFAVFRAVSWLKRGLSPCSLRLCGDIQFLLAPMLRCALSSWFGGVYYVLETLYAKNASPASPPAKKPAITGQNG